MLKFNTQKIKYFISGVIVSGLLTSTIAFANPIQQFILQKSEYPMLINGNAFKSDSPILNYEGKTYIPLKDVGNLLQCNVKWDSELKRIEISKEVNKEVKSDENKYNENINSNSNHGAGGGGIYSPVNNEKQRIQLQSKQTDNTDNTNNVSNIQTQIQTNNSKYEVLKDYPGNYNRYPIRYNGNIYLAIRDGMNKYNIPMDGITYDDGNKEFTFIKTNIVINANNKSDVITIGGISYIRESIFENNKY